MEHNPPILNTKYYGYPLQFFLINYCFYSMKIYYIHSCMSDICIWKWRNITLVDSNDVCDYDSHSNSETC